MAMAQYCSRERKRLHRLKKVSREALKSSLSAEEFRIHLKAIVRLSGGWSGLRDELPAVERAKLAVTLAKVADREAKRAEAERRHEALSAAVLNSPAMQADLRNMSQDWVTKHPVRAMRVVLCDKPQLAARMLMETERGRAALRRALERDPQALQES